MFVEPDDGTPGWAEAGLWVRERLSPAARIDGPAVIAEKNATTVVEPGWQAVVRAGGALELQRVCPRAPRQAIGTEAVAELALRAATEAAQSATEVTATLRAGGLGDASAKAIESARLSLAVRAPVIRNTIIAGTVPAAAELLQAVGDPVSRGLLATQRAEVEWLTGDASASRAALAEAEALAAGAAAGPDSELGKAIARLRERLAA
jgi:hypothetical protein